MKELGGMNQNRRDWMRTTARMGALSILAWIGLLPFTRHTSEHEPSVCERSNPCHSCAVFNRCGFPQAISVRRAKQEGSDEC